MKAWEQFLQQQEHDLGLETANRWLKNLRVLHFDACNLYIEAKDYFHVLWFEEHMRHKVNTALLNNNNKHIKVHLSIPQKNEKIAPKSKVKKSLATLSPSLPPFSLSFDSLDSHYSLENFVLNPHTILVHKLLSKIVNHPAELAAFNPIFIYGCGGSGKTHLLMAVAQALQSKNLKVIYARAETFTEHVVTAIRAGEMGIFRQVYRNSDVLIIDDVHIFSRKSATQEELFHTFNTLNIHNKQIILSANCAPNELQMIEPRLVSRFEWGIVLPLVRLNQEERRKMLESKLTLLNFSLSPKVIDFLLHSFPHSTQSLIKALQALILRSHVNDSMSSLQLTLPDVKRILTDLITEEEQNALTSSKIVQIVAQYFGIKAADVMGKSQTRDCVLPRQLTMFLCRHYLKIPFLKIGEFFDRDHSTVISSVKAIQKALDEHEPTITLPYTNLLQKIQSI